MFPIKDIHNLTNLIPTCKKYRTNALTNELGSSLAEQLVKSFEENNWRPIDESVLISNSKLKEAQNHLITYGFLVALNVIGKKNSKSEMQYHLCDSSEFFTGVENINDIYKQEGYTLEIVLTQYYQQQQFNVILTN